MGASLVYRVVPGSAAWYVFSNYFSYLVAAIAVTLIAGVFVYFMGRKEAGIPVVGGVVGLLVLNLLFGVPEFWAMTGAWVLVTVVFGLLPRVTPRLALT